MPPYSYRWSFGDGATGPGPDTTHAYAVAGNYTATLGVRDVGGNGGGASVGITVNSRLVAFASSSMAASDVGISIGFLAHVRGGTAPYSYLWTLGDTSSSTVIDTTHSYQAPGTYSVELIVNDSLGEGSSSAPIELTVNSLPEFSGVLVTPNVTDAGSHVSFFSEINGGTGPFTYQYAGLPAGCSSTLSSFTCTPLTTGTYSVGAVATDAVGSQAVANTVLEVDSPPTVGLQASSSADVINSPVTLTTTPSGGVRPYTYSYAGLPAGCASADVANFTCSPSTAGAFIVTVTVTDAVNRSASASVPLVVAAAAPSSRASPAELSPITMTELYLIIGAAWLATVLTLVLFLHRMKRRLPPVSQSGSTLDPR